MLCLNNSHQRQNLKQGQPAMELKDLKANPRNPRTVTKERLGMLEAALKEFGDLGCIIFNRESGHLVGGHQRLKALPKNSTITLTKNYKTPTKTGTVAEGNVSVEGENFKYREVVWDEFKEDQAILAANKQAGEWEQTRVSEMLRRLDDFNLNVSLTMFDHQEFKLLTTTPKIKKPKAPAEPSDKTKEKKRVICPECDHRFVPGWS